MKKTLLASTIILASVSFSTQAASLNAGFGSNTLAANDDGSTSAIDITSVFADGLNFFGTTYNSLYLNNNGNLTFDRAQSTYTPSAITADTSNPMLAAYFADVDTRGTAGTVTPGGNSTGTNRAHWDFDTTAGTFTATWDDVGYYDTQSDLLNAFQIVLTDQGNGDFDIEFRYEELNWTTGSASGGSNGLGGTVARAGWTSGNGSDFFELAASGNQAAMLNLVNTSNVNVAGVYQFGVRNGGVIELPPIDMPRIPVPASAFLFAPALLGFVGLRRKAKKLAA